MTTTPRTDEAAFEERGMPGSLVVHIDFSRRLELEVSGLKESLTGCTNTIARQQSMLDGANAREQEHTQMFAVQKNFSAALQDLLISVCSESSLPTASVAVTELKEVQVFRRRSDAAKAAQERKAAAELEALNTKLREANERNIRLSEDILKEEKRAASLTTEVDTLTARNTALAHHCIELSTTATVLFSHLPDNIKPDARSIVAEWAQFHADPA
jgi:hypothetical protein